MDGGPAAPADGAGADQHAFERQVSPVLPPVRLCAPLVSAVGGVG